MEKEGKSDADGRSTITVNVKFSGRSIPVEISDDSTVKRLKSLLQPLTNVLSRGQKLIFKGKVLVDEMTLKSSEVGNGAKIMLMASQGLHQGKIKVSLFQHGVKLLIIDSMAALLSGEGVQGPQRQHSLGWHISFIKSVAEFSRIPVVVTNQVRSQIRDGTSHYSFQEQSRGESPEAATNHDSHLVAALGIHWAHAVSIRLIFESRSGQRFIKLAKSPLSPPLAFPFNITSSGILLLNDDGVEMLGPDIHSISCQGHNDVINFGTEMMH